MILVCAASSWEILVCVKSSGCDVLVDVSDAGLRLGKIRWVFFLCDLLGFRVLGFRV